MKIQLCVRVGSEVRNVESEMTLTLNLTFSLNLTLTLTLIGLTLWLGSVVRVMIRTNHYHNTSLISIIIL